MDVSASQEDFDGPEMCDDHPIKLKVLSCANKRLLAGLLWSTIMETTLNGFWRANG